MKLEAGGSVQLTLWGSQGEVRAQNLFGEGFGIYCGFLCVRWHKAATKDFPTVFYQNPRET